MEKKYYTPKMETVKGDLIELAMQGKFDVIAHGCNCQCVMGAGIALQMDKAFDCKSFPKEAVAFKADYNKLGTIDYREFTWMYNHDLSLTQLGRPLTVVNAYTQFRYGRGSLDYTALRMCMQKINHIFAGKHLGLPKIGAGLAGGSWHIIELILREELTEVKTTIVTL